LLCEVFKLIEVRRKTVIFYAANWTGIERGLACRCPCNCFSCRVRRHTLLGPKPKLAVPASMTVSRWLVGALIDAVLILIRLVRRPPADNNARRDADAIAATAALSLRHTVWPSTLKHTQLYKHLCRSSS